MNGVGHSMTYTINKIQLKIDLQGSDPNLRATCHLKMVIISVKSGLVLWE